MGQRAAVDKQNAKLNFSERLAYGFGDGATGFAGVMVTSFAMYYFTDVIGVAAGLLGTILMLSRVLDGITNVLMGYIVDKTRTKYGKARPWVLGATIPLVASLIVLFSVPSSWEIGNQVLYIVLAYNFYFLMYTISNIPYGTLGTLITRDQKERSNLNIARMLGYFIVMLIVSNVTIPLVELFGGDTAAWQWTAGLYGLIMIAMFSYTFFGTTERVKPAKGSTAGEDVPLGESLKTIVTNKYWVMIFFIILSGWAMLDILMGINVYYAEHILKDVSIVGRLAMFFTIPLLVGFLSVGYFNARFGRMKTLYLGLTLMIIGSALVIIDGLNVPLDLASTALRGFGFSALMGNAYAMLADTIDYGEWKSGMRIEGLTFSGGTFATTLGHGLGSAGIGWILGAGGYVSGGGTAAQPDGVFFVIDLLFIYIPIIIAIIIMILLHFYKLDDIYQDIIHDLFGEDGED